MHCDTMACTRFIHYADWLLAFFAAYARQRASYRSADSYEKTHTTA